MRNPRNSHSAWRTAGFLILLWTIVTAFNLTKPFHIDDTAHIKIAHAIMDDPLHAMQAQFNWVDTREPIHTMNQPHLFFYLLTLWMTLFGESEIALHLLIAIFSLLAIILFYRLAQIVAEKNAMWVTALFALGPAFIPSQNVMVDVPLLALWLAFFYALFRADQAARNNWIAALALAAALLVKYTSLVLLPIFVLTILLRKDRRALWFVCIPIVTLLLWSLFNYWDYGGIHLLGREPTKYSAVRFLIRGAAWLICLGAISPFVLAFVGLKRADKKRRWLLGVSAFILVVTFVTSFVGLEENVATTLLRGVFLASGVFLTGLLFLQTYENLRNSDEVQRSRQVILIAWFVGAGIFIILFSPAIAVRHVLLVVPAALLAIYPQVVETGRSRRLLAMILTVGLGFGLGISDYEYAGIYRDKAPEILATYQEPDSDIWFTGHWGWNYYAEKAGMLEYDRLHAKPKGGDLLVAPDFVDKQSLAAADSLRLQAIDEVIISGTLATFLRVGPPAGYFASSIRRLPWTLATGPVERFIIYLFRQAPDHSTKN